MICASFDVASFDAFHFGIPRIFLTHGYPAQPPRF